MAGASTHDEEMENFMTAEILMPAVEDRKLQRIDHTSDRIDDAARQKPSESCHTHGI